MEEIPCRFSIIIPVYKVEKELKRCIDSVLSQRFQNYEVLLIDDGSPDACGRICDDYVKKDNRVHCVHQENGGVSAARNAGINLAVGEYLIFLDSDDMWNDSEALEKIDRILLADPKTDLVCFGYTLFDADGNKRKTCIPANIAGNQSRYETIRQLVYHYQYYNAAYVKAVKRSLLTDYQLFFEKGILSEDIGWSGRLLTCAKHIAVFSSAFYCYMLRKSGSITSSVGKKNLVDILDQIDHAVSEIQALNEDAETKALYYEYWAYQYAMILGDVPRIREKEDYRMLVRRCRKNAFLLKYHHQKKVRLVSFLYRAIGLRATMRVLCVYMKLTWR